MTLDYTSDYHTRPLDSTRTHIEVDVAWCCELQNFLKPLSKHQGRLEAYQAVGPAGGNPCVLLSFPTREQAVTYFETTFGTDISTFDMHEIDPKSGKAVKSCLDA